MNQTKISTKTDKDGGFSRAVFRKRLEKDTSVSKFLVCCFCVLFSMAKSILRMGSCVRFCRHNISFLCTKCGEGSTWSVL